MCFIGGIPVVSVAKFGPGILVVEVALVVAIDAAVVDPLLVLWVDIGREADVAAAVVDFFVGAGAEEVGGTHPEFNKVAVLCIGWQAE